MRGRAWSCAVVRAWSVMRGRARSPRTTAVPTPPPWGGVGTASSNKYGSRGRSCAVVRGRVQSCAVVRAWSVMRGRARSVVRGHAWSCVRGRARSCMHYRSCVVVRGSAWSCMVVRGHARSVVRGRAWSCVVVRGRAWSCVVVRGRSCAVVCAWSVMRGRAWSCTVGRVRSCVVVQSCRSAVLPASWPALPWHERTNERTTSNNPLNPPGVGWVNFFKVRVSIRTCVPNLGVVPTAVSKILSFKFISRFTTSKESENPLFGKYFCNDMYIFRNTGLSN